MLIWILVTIPFIGLPQEPRNIYAINKIKVTQFINIVSTYFHYLTKHIPNSYFSISSEQAPCSLVSWRTQLLLPLSSSLARHLKSLCIPPRCSFPHDGVISVLQRVLLICDLKNRLLEALYTSCKNDTCSQIGKTSVV